MIVAALLGLSLSLQLPDQAPARADARATHPASHSSRIGAPTDSGVTAVHADAPPTIDGKDDDAIWRTAPQITGFRQWQPTEGKTPRFKTEAKVAYDAANLYVFVRSFDPHPDSIIKLLERRDSFTPSDMVWVFIDSYHDRRSGYEFGVNAAGVKLDQAVSNGGNEDGAWDAVWDVATRIDSLGWTAEFRIPLSQLRYAPAAEHQFGVMIMRDVARRNERYSWPVYRRSRPGLASQFAEVGGFVGLSSPRRIEVAPYAVSKNVSVPRPDGFGRAQKQTVGGDLKYGVTSNLTLDATVNPDFGQA